MKCTACGGQLVIRETLDSEVNEQGVFIYGDQIRTVGLCCRDCGAGHAYEEIYQSGGRHTIALSVNSDPVPVATVAIAFSNGIISTLEADKHVGLLVVDQDRREVGRFMAGQNHHAEWWNWVQKLAASIPRGEYATSFEVEEEK